MLGTILNKVSGPILVLLFFLYPPVLAQERQASLGLISYIKSLENRFDVRFSYIDNDLKGYDLLPFDESLSLEEILDRLASRFNLEVQKLSARYYTLNSRDTVDICGSVLDNFARNSIPGASVEVMGSGLARITDQQGLFSMDRVPKDALLKIRYLGYLTKYVQVAELMKEGGCPQILLAQYYEKLEEVTVYKFLTTGIYKESDASIIMDLDEFGILPGLTEADVLQSVQSLPGIKSIDETVSDINIRGGTNDQNLILWNGIKMYQSGHFFGLISAFNPYLTDRVTIHKNGTPAAFGDGVSGIIEMNTDDRVPEQWKGGGGFDLISGEVHASVPLGEKWGLHWSARRSITDFLKTPTYKQFFERALQDSEITDGENNTVSDGVSREEDFFFHDFAGKLLFTPNDKLRIGFSFINIKNHLDHMEFRPQEDRRNLSQLKQDNLSLGVQILNQWNPNFASRLDLYCSRYNLDANSRFANGVQSLFQNNKVLENSLKLNTKYRLGDHLVWNNGYQFIETGITNITRLNQPDFDSAIKGVIRIHAPFSQLNYTSRDKKFLGRIGARVNFVENLDTFTKVLLEPRVNLNLGLAKYLRAELLGEFKSQTTNQVIDLEQNFLGIEKRRWVLSNDSSLPVTRSKQLSLGLNYERNRLYIGLEGFQKVVDGISTATQGFQNQYQFSGEIGSYRVKGIELLINKKSDALSGWLSYSYNKNDYRFDSIVPREFPNNLDIRHSLTLAGTYSHGKFKFGIGLNYRTGKPYTRPLEGDAALDRSIFPARIVYRAPNSSRLSEYFRTDASVIYGFNLGPGLNARAGISILNLTDRRNRLNKYYRINENDEIETVENVSLGLTPNFSFRLAF